MGDGLGEICPTDKAFTRRSDLLRRVEDLRCSTASVVFALRLVDADLGVGILIVVIVAAMEVLWQLEVNPFGELRFEFPVALRGRWTTTVFVGIYAGDRCWCI